MSDQKKETQVEKKRRVEAERKHTPAAQSPDLVAEALPDPSIAFKGGTVASQVETLHRLGPIQCRAMLMHISRVQGNAHAQRLMAAMRQSGHEGASVDAQTAQPAPQTEIHPARATTPKLSAKPLLPQAVQAKLSVSQPEDPYEQEAERMATEVMRMPPAPATPPPPDEGDKGVGKAAAIKRAASQLESQGDGQLQASAEAESRIQRMRGGGHPMPDTERAFFEDRMGVDLGGVRLHTSEQAVQTSQDLQAQAFTVGSDIMFGQGKYQPGTQDGRRLMAHELTHVVQQGGAPGLRPKVNRCASADCRADEAVLKRTAQRQAIGPIKRLSSERKANRCATPNCRADEALLKSTVQRQATDDEAKSKRDWALEQEARARQEQMAQSGSPGSPAQMLEHPAAHTPAGPMEAKRAWVLEQEAQARQEQMARSGSLRQIEVGPHAQAQATPPQPDGKKPAPSDGKADKADARLGATALTSEAPSPGSATTAPAKEELAPVEKQAFETATENQLPMTLKPEGERLPTAPKAELAATPPTSKETVGAEINTLPAKPAPPASAAGLAEKDTSSAIKATVAPEKPVEPAAAILVESLAQGGENLTQMWQAGQGKTAAGLPDLKSMPLSEAWATARQHAADVEGTARAAAEQKKGALEAAPKLSAQVKPLPKPGELLAGAAVEKPANEGMSSAAAKVTALPQAPEMEKPATEAAGVQAQAPVTPTLAPEGKRTADAKPPVLETNKAQPPQAKPPVEDVLAAAVMGVQPETLIGEKQPEAAPKRVAAEPQAAKKGAQAESPAGPPLAPAPSTKVEAAPAQPAISPEAKSLPTVASQDKATDKTVLIQREPLLVQREGLLESLIPDWAQALLDSLTGAADDKKGELSGEGNSKSGELNSTSKSKGQELEDAGTFKGSELQSDGNTKGAELEGDGGTKGTELQADQQAKGTELQSDQEAKGAELQSDQEAKSAELQADQQAKGAELQADQETKGAELEADQQAKGAELQADQETKSTELQADANAKASELNQSWSQTEQQATQLESNIVQQVDTQATALQTQATAANTQVETAWAQLQANAETTVQTLDTQANELCSLCQGKADEYMATFDPLVKGAQEGWQQVQTEAKTAWDGFMKSAQPTLDKIGQKWQEFTAWAGPNVWEPLKQKAGEFANQVGQLASQAWTSAQQMWSTLTQNWANADQWIAGRADAARAWIAGRADAARAFIAGKADAARAWITGRADAAQAFISGKADAARTFISDKADAARTFISDKADAARTYISGKADAANAWITGKGDAARTWITSRGDAARTWISGRATAAASWIQSKVGAAQAWIQGKGQAITESFRSQGQALVSGLAGMARGAASSISSRGGPIGKWFGGIISGLASGVESVGNSAVNQVSNAMGAGLGWVESKASAAVGLVGNMGTGAVNFVGSAATGAVSLVQNTATGAVNFVQNAATGAVSVVSNAATGAVNFVQNTATGAVNLVANAATGAVNFVQNAATGAVNLVANAATGAVTWVESKATGVVNALEAAGTGAVTWVEGRALSAVQFVKDAWSAIQSGWSSLTAWLGPKLQWVGQKASELAGQINTNIIQPASQWVQQQWGNLQSYVAEKFPGLAACWDTLKEFAGAAWDKFQELPLVKEVTTAVGEMIQGAILGDFIDNPSMWNIVGQVLVGFIPGADQVTDIRDLFAAIKKVVEGKEGAWLDLSMALVGAIPGIGNAIKAGKHLDKVDEVADVVTTVSKNLDEVLPYTDEILAPVVKYGDEGIEAVSTAVTKYGDEVAEAVAKGGDEAVETIVKHGDEGAESLIKNADEVGDAGKYADWENKAPYDPRQWRSHLEEKYGVENVSSTTVPPSNAPGVRWAGGKHPTSGVPYDSRGFPVFDDYAKTETHIPSDIAAIDNPQRQMRAATRELRQAIADGKIDPSMFTKEQLDAIRSGGDKIPGYTWHHHQDVGRMQLIPEGIHNATKPHTGGAEMWLGK